MAKRACPQCHVLCDERDFRCGCGYDFAAADSEMRLRARREAASEKPAPHAVPDAPAGKAEAPSPAESPRRPRRWAPLLAVFGPMAVVFGVMIHLWGHVVLDNASRDAVSEADRKRLEEYMARAYPPKKGSTPRLPERAGAGTPDDPGPLRPPVVLVRIAGAESDPVFVPDGKGGGGVLWIEPRGSRGNVVLAKRLLPTGEISWSGDRGLEVSRGEGRRRDLTALADGDQGVMCIWTEERGGVPSVMLQRLTWSGAGLFPPGGLEPGSFSKRQEGGRVARDRQGRTLVFWREPIVAGHEVYFQRLDASGKILGPANGTPVPGVSGQIGILDVLADPEGGCILAWTLPQAPYARFLKLSAEGKPVWRQPATIAAIGSPVSWLALQHAGGAGFWAVWRCGDERPSRFRSQRVTPAGEAAGSAVDLGRITLGSEGVHAALAPASGPVLLLGWVEAPSVGPGHARFQRCASGKCAWPLEGLQARKVPGDIRRVACLGDGTPKSEFLVALGEATGAGRVWAVRTGGETGSELRSDCGAFEGMSGAPDWIALAPDGKGGGVVVWRAPAGPGFTAIAAQRIDRIGIAGGWDAGK